MNIKLKKYIKEIVKYLILITIILNIISYFKSSDLNKDKLNIKAFNSINNEIYTVNNKPLILHFWATWCPTCKIEAHNIERISKHFEVMTIAVESGEKKDIIKYLKDNKLTLKVQNDENGSFSQKFNIKAFPTTLIYDKEKNLVFSEVGYTSTFGLYLRMLWIKYFK